MLIMIPGAAKVLGFLFLKDKYLYRINLLTIIYLYFSNLSAGVQNDMGSSPRQLAIVNEQKAYVSNLYTNDCSIIDMQSMTVSGNIQVGANPEGIAIANKKLYVANSGFGYGSSVLVVSVNNDQVTDELTVGDNPITLQVDDDNGLVYILCSGSYGDFGDPNDDTPGSLWKIDANSDTIIDSLIIAGHPSRLCLGSNNNGYFIGAGTIVNLTGKI